MKIGRNELCPCGSGKKFKKCCMLKPDIEENSLLEIDDDDDYYFEEEDDEQLRLINLFHGLHHYMLERKPHIKQYKKIRKLHSEIIQSMVDYYEKGNFQHGIDPNYVPPIVPKGHNKNNDTVLLNMCETNFDMRTREGTQAFFDLIVYKAAPNLNCITETYIEKRKFRKPEKIELLKCMLNSTIGLFEITGVEAGNGYAYLKEVFTGEEFKLTDIGLSGNVDIEGNYIYTRIITYDGISFSTGLSLAFEKKDKFIKDFIKKEKKGYSPLGELKRFIDLYNRFAGDKNRVSVFTQPNKLY